MVGRPPPDSRFSQLLGAVRPVGAAIENHDPFLHIGKSIEGHVPEHLGRFGIICGKCIDKVDMAPEKFQVGDRHDTRVGRSLPHSLQSSLALDTQIETDLQGQRDILPVLHITEWLHLFIG